MSKVHSYRGGPTVTIHQSHRGSNTDPPKPKPVFFVYRPHQGKEQAYVKALKSAGYRPSLVERMRLKFVLFDIDCYRRKPIVERYIKRGVPVFLYPHTARPQIGWDGIWEGVPEISCNFVIAPGHEEVMRRYGYEPPIEVTGWTFCPIKPFEPVKEVKHILFGPMHPGVSGHQPQIDIETNQKTFARLLEYCKDTGAQLTVRHIKKLEMSGLHHVAGVEYVMGMPNLAIKEIDAADLVIGHQTFGYLAVARGKPVLMMGEDIPPHSIGLDHSTLYVKSWEKYADIMMYPLDALSEDIGTMVDKARHRSAAVTTWRKQFIGEQFIPEYFVERLKSYL